MDHFSQSLGDTMTSQSKRCLPAIFLRSTIVPLLVLAAACETSSSKSIDAKTDAPVFAEAYKIGIGDTLKVDVYRNPDLSVTVPVRPDGKITVPVAGDVMVGGQTPEEVSKTIAASLGEYIRDPIVTTTVSGMGSSEYLTRVRVTD